MSNESLAFFMGLLGSMHCVAMCGPLVMAFPAGGGSVWYALVQKIVYQAGRIATYSAFGFAAGFIGKSFQVLGLQQFLGLFTGILLVLIALIHFSKRKFSSLDRMQVRFISPWVAVLGKLIHKPYGSFFAGMIHGFLPCGMVYMALAAALNSGTSPGGAQFMFFFGLGTTPLLLLVAIAPLFLRKLKLSVSVIPYLFLLSGLLLIVKGLNMNIPHFSSPVPVNSTAVECK